MKYKPIPTSLLLLVIMIGILGYPAFVKAVTLREIENKLRGPSWQEQVEQQLYQFDVEILEAKGNNKLTPEFYDNIISQAEQLLIHTLNEKTQLIIRQAIANYKIQKNDLIILISEQQEKLAKEQYQTKKTHEEIAKQQEELEKGIEISKSMETQQEKELQEKNLFGGDITKKNSSLGKKILNSLILISRSIKNFIEALFS